MSFSYKKYNDECNQGDFVIIKKTRNKSSEMRNEEQKETPNLHKSSLEKIVDKYGLLIHDQNNQEIKVKKFSTSSSISPPFLNINFNECKSETIKSQSKSSSNSKSIGISISLDKENSPSNSSNFSDNISPEIISRRPQISSVNCKLEQDSHKNTNDDIIQMNTSANHLLETESINIVTGNDPKLLCSEQITINGKSNLLLENDNIALFPSINFYFNLNKNCFIISVFLILLVLLIIIIVSTN
jgi:hypothetical protein